ncbi:MAG: DUF1232 domain-containing protein [Bacteroidales bacterium]|nr:DUF1232 domain-containing protein [Bacteroidales bacterium]
MDVIKKIKDLAASAPETIHRYARNFSDTDFWNKIASVAGKIGGKLLYMLLALYYSLGTASTRDRLMIAGALGYFILPTDLLPDFLPGGFTDDLAAMTAVYQAIKGNMSEDTKNKARAKTDEIIG